MKLFDQYLLGEPESVYLKIDRLGKDAFSIDQFPEIDKILTKTFQRVSYNLDVIYSELTKIGYLFKSEYTDNFQRPLHKPLPDTENLLNKLDRAVKPFGHVPLSLKYFYRIVGGVNFCWDYDTDDRLMWNLADPIQIASLDAVVETVWDEDWKVETLETVEEESSATLILSADDLHKDNISGAGGYQLEITKSPQIDSRFLNEPNNTTFINYLRICFANCGFPGLTRPGEDNDYYDFFRKVKPLLKGI